MAINMLKIIGKMASKKAVFDDLSKNSTKIAEKMIILPVHMLSEADLWPIYGQYMLIFARSLIYRHICNPPSLYAGNKVSEPSQSARMLAFACRPPTPRAHGTTQGRPTPSSSAISG